MKPSARRAPLDAKARGVIYFIQREVYILTDPVAFLKEVTALPGPSGFEAIGGGVAHKIREAFRPFADETRIDAMSSVHATQKAFGAVKKPLRVAVFAHSDEIALIVKAIDDRGFLKVHRIGGVDPRVLPACDVTVHGKQTLFGVCGAKPPHLQTEDERGKAVKLDEIAVDVGLPADEVKALVSVGDIVTFNAPLVELDSGRIAGKTMDDRACVAIELMAAEMLSRMKPACEVVFVASSQEEVGCKGAATSAYALRPDIAIALDVTHAPQPGADALDVVPIDKPAIAQGPNLHPRLTERALKLAKHWGIEYSVDICPTTTGTDAYATQITAGGIPSLLLQLPLKYMHTTVELCDTAAMRRCAQWIAAFVMDLKDGEEVTFD